MPARLYHVASTLFFVALLAMTALMCVRAPYGGFDFAGVHLFAGPGLAHGFLAALSEIGIAGNGRAAVLGLLGALSAAAAGLLVFALMFLGFGEPPERREARGFYQMASALAAIAAMIAGLVALAAGEANGLFMLLSLLFVALAAVHATFDFGAATAGAADADLDRLVSGSAASHAAFTAQILSLSGRGDAR